MQKFLKLNKTVLKLPNFTEKIGMAKFPECYAGRNDFTLSIREAS